MKSLNLNGEWSVRQTTATETIPARVPGCIHTDLLNAGVLSDPFIRAAEFDSYWVGESDWEYSRTFEIDEEFLNHDKIRLVCKGLDTLALILVNETEVGRTDNMFRSYKFDLREVLVPGSNTIRILFASALNYTVEKNRKRPLFSWNQDIKLGESGHIRKEQCNFGWDWGIRTVTCGIWRDIELTAFSGSRLQDVHIRQDHSSPGTVALLCETAVERGKEETLQLVVRVTHEGAAVAQTGVDADKNSGPLQLEIRNPQLWWPNTMGEQPLYEVTVSLQDPEGRVLDSWERRIGLRTLRLVRESDEWGESFRFAINGVPFFAKGANWIPADAFNNRVSPERYRDLLESSAWANMNMLRVWGGGIYEEEIFYDLCDELGICVWQDFMYACSTYPTDDPAFLANIEQEAVENVRRLRSHASLALWCGNNELEQGLAGPETTPTCMSWTEYAKIFDQMLPRIVAELDGETDYWPGSPHSPCGDRMDHGNPRCGDAHLWDVWHGRQPFEWYRSCEHRFNSEFGFQSFPEPKTTYGYTAPGDRNITSYVMEHHQRSGAGNSIIMHYMLEWFRLPSGFDETLWSSQILQGLAIKYAVEHWRRSMPRGMGTLYWQLNDMWPVASWSSIDYHHRWKALHYMARRFFAPILLSAVEDEESGTIEIHVTSDRQESRELRLHWYVTDTSGTELRSGDKAVTCGPNSDCMVHTLEVKDLIEARGVRNLLVWMELRDGRNTLSKNLVTFARPKHLELNQAPQIDVSVSRTAEGYL